MANRRRAIVAVPHRIRPKAGRFGRTGETMGARASFCYRSAMPATPAWPPASTPRLFVDQPLGPDAAPTLDGAAAHYLLNVMRMKPGDPLLPFDDRSGEWLARSAAGRVGKEWVITCRSRGALLH